MEPISDTALGTLVLHLLPGPLYYLPALLLPMAGLLGGLLATNAAPILSAAAGQVWVRHALLDGAPGHGAVNRTGSPFELRSVTHSTTHSVTHSKLSFSS